MESLNAPHQTCRILVVDDEPANVLLLEFILGRHGYSNVRSTTDSRLVISLCEEFRPDLLLLDLHMPHLSGFEIMEQLRQVTDPEDYFPILVLTADATDETKHKALASGAKDYLHEPFDRIEVLLRVGNLLETRMLHVRLNEDRHTLEQHVVVRVQELEEAQMEIVERLAAAAEYRDSDTGQHTRRVGNLAARVAQLLALPEEQVALIRRAAPLHDVGKIGIPDEILLKPGPLTPEEMEVMRSHVTIGAGILSGSHFPLLQIAEEIALYHHERWDGSGYCCGLSGEGIPLAGRIVAVLDVYDALTSERPYKRAWSISDAVKEIRSQSGRQFDPDVVEALIRVLTEDGSIPENGLAGV